MRRDRDNKQKRIEGNRKTSPKKTRYNPAPSQKKKRRGRMGEKHEKKKWQSLSRGGKKILTTIRCIPKARKKMIAQTTKKKQNTTKGKTRAQQSSGRRR